VKRVLIGAGLVVALAFPATIIAGVRHYEGTVDQGGTTRFLTKVRHGETVKVRRFVFNHVPMQCDNGPSTVGDVGTPPPGMKVNAQLGPMPTRAPRPASAPATAPATRPATNPVAATEMGVAP